MNKQSSSWGGEAKSKLELQSIDFLATLNNYVKTFNENSEDIKLKKWKLENGNYPTFE